MGEVNYDRLRTSDAKAWIQSHPRKFGLLTLARFIDFWFPAREDHPFNAMMIWISTLLSIPGLLLMAHARQRITLFILFVLLVYPLMYYIVVSDARYRIPVLWLSLLPSGYFVVRQARLLSKLRFLRD